MTVAALIVAAGRGARAGAGRPKQYRILAGRAVLDRTLEPFVVHPGIDTVAVAIHPEDADVYAEAVSAWLREGSSLAAPVHGGETRQATVRLGLEALADRSPGIVLVHDAARPFATAALIDRAIAAARRFHAAVPGIPVTDTIKILGEGSQVIATPDRTALRAIQTPQAFRFDSLLAAHRRALAEGRDGFTDDGGLMEWAGANVHVFEGDPRNLKLTHPADFEASERDMEGSAMQYVTRLGTGFDVHAFGDGDHVWLGGLKVPHEQSVIAHSDGDVILHALTDAVLGAMADGDIGTHFPPSDPQWRGASSDRFLAYAVDRLRRRGGRIDHLDVTLLCEAPRLGPHREDMRRRIAGIAGVEIGRVSVKATTTEALGFTGRREGIAAQAAATIRLPEDPE
ncbi:MAG: bifunctional 2-C-methyl-D-erythritol 4-phosphate cytidylyltransferase/2-C-methyl-D-erythritol 2,4-cyclodiphosphate synthase [Microvirga sp.]